MNGALNILENLTPQNAVETLLKQAYLFNINEYKQPNAITGAQRAILQEHVYDLPKKYGEAIYRLRATLFEEVYDYPGTGRFANPNFKNANGDELVSNSKPNPTSGTIAFDLKLTRETYLILSDVYGKVLARQKINADVKNITLELNQYETGIYFVTFKQGATIIKNAKVVLIK